MDRTRLAANLVAVEERIEAALRRAGRSGPVKIVAVTKGHRADAVRMAADVGLRWCGENRVQELEAKRAELGDLVEWHFIGHLQRNKVRKVLPLCDLIQSVDSLRLAEEISTEAMRAGRVLPVLVQVNSSGEASKGGFPVDQGVEGVARVCALGGLRVCGLMTMAPLTEDRALIRRTFAATRGLFEACSRHVPGFAAEHLSMGMSHDFEEAVEEGATVVRLGTILFGERVQ